MNWSTLMSSQHRNFNHVSHWLSFLQDKVGNNLQLFQCQRILLNTPLSIFIYIFTQKNRNNIFKVGWHGWPVISAMCADILNPSPQCHLTDKHHFELSFSIVKPILVNVVPSSTLCLTPRAKSAQIGVNMIRNEGLCSRPEEAWCAVAPEQWEAVRNYRFPMRDEKGCFQVSCSSDLPAVW